MATGPKSVKEPNTKARAARATMVSQKVPSTKTRAPVAANNAKEPKVQAARSVLEPSMKSPAQVAATVRSA